MDAAPIIITGCPRSGTQMMARVFGNLSTDFFLITEHTDKGTDVPEENSQVEDHRLWWEHFQYEAWNDAKQCPSIDVPIAEDTAITRIRERYLQLAEGRRIVIKNPSHILYPGLMRQVFPTAKFVFCARNPWHTLQSMVKQGRDSFLLLSPRAADSSISLLLRAAIGWSDAFASFEGCRDQDWVVAQYENITAAPHDALTKICAELGLGDSETLDIARAATIPQPSRSNFHFIKQAFQESAEQAAVTEELRAGCTALGYPLTPRELDGSSLAYTMSEIAEKWKYKTVRHLKRCVG